MNEKRLYYNNSYIKNFSSKIIERYNKNDKEYLILKETAFYPLSGGQPCDGGSINGVPLEDIFEREDGEIVHVLSKNLNMDIESEVFCEIDWEKRFEHMQQHTGQHILSQAFFNLYSFQTVSFHLGKDTSTIDLDIVDLSSEQIFRSEKAANEIIFYNRPIRIRYLSEEEVKKIGLRKETERSGMVRIIDMEDFDLSACGGTHCNSTGEVGVILINGWEKIKNKIRIEFVCGFRAINLFRKYDNIFKEISSQFSVGLQDIIPRISKLILENKDREKALRKFKEKYMEQEIDNLYGSGTEKGDIKYVFQLDDDKTFDDMKVLAKGVISKFPKVLLCLASSSNIVIARSVDLSFNLSEFIKAFNKDAKGKSGGTPDFIQGGGYKAEEIEKLFYELENKF